MYFTATIILLVSHISTMFIIQSRTSVPILWKTQVNRRFISRTNPNFAEKTSSTNPFKPSQWMHIFLVLDVVLYRLTVCSTNFDTFAGRPTKKASPRPHVNIDLRGPGHVCECVCVCSSALFWLAGVTAHLVEHRPRACQRQTKTHTQYT